MYKVIWEERKRNQWNSKTGKADVSITLFKSGNSRFSVRFAMRGKILAKIREGFYFARVSSVKGHSRIYFDFAKDNDSMDYFKIISRDTSAPYITFTVFGETEKAYRTNWIGKGFDAKFDEENGLFYIEKE